MAAGPASSGTVGLELFLCLSWLTEAACTPWLTVRSSSDICFLLPAISLRLRPHPSPASLRGTSVTARPIRIPGAMYLRDTTDRVPPPASARVTYPGTPHGHLEATLPPVPWLPTVTVPGGSGAGKNGARGCIELGRAWALPTLPSHRNSYRVRGQASVLALVTGLGSTRRPWWLSLVYPKPMLCGLQQTYGGEGRETALGMPWGV